MADYLVTTDFRAKDLVSPQLRHMESETRRFAKSAQTSLGSIFKGSFLGTMGANLLTSGLARVRQGVTSVINDYMDLDSAVNAAAVKFGGIDYGSEKFRELSSVAREVGRTTKFTSGDAASGLEALAAAGFKAEESMKLLPTVANFAAAAKMNLAEGTEVAGKSLRAFAMASEDAAIQSANLTRISDVLAKTDASTGATMYGLAETVAWAASRFTAAGQSLESFGAIAGGLANVKIEGSIAGTVMKQMVSQLTDVGGKGTAALRKMGLSFKKDLIDNKGNLLNIVDILGKMEEPLKRMGTATRSKVLQDLFGERAAGGVVALINGGIDSVKKLEAELMNAAGTSKTMGDQLNQSLTFRIMALQNALQEKGFQVFEGLLVDGRGGIEGMIQAINEFDVKPIVEGLKAMGSGIKWLIDHRSDILRVGIALGTIKAALMLRSGIQSLGMLPSMISGMSMGSLSLPLMHALRGGVPAPQMPIIAGYPGVPQAPAQVMTKTVSGVPTTVSSVGRITLGSVANVVFAAGTAAVIGYQIGDWIRSTFVDPEIEKGAKAREKSTDIEARLLNALHGKTSVQEKERLLKEAEQSRGELMPSYTEQLVGGVTSGLNNLFSSDKIKSPMEQFRERGMAMTETMMKLRLAMEEQIEKQRTSKPSVFNEFEPNTLGIITKLRDKKFLEENPEALYKKAYQVDEDPWSIFNSANDKLIKELKEVQENRKDVLEVKIEVSGDKNSKVTTTTKTSGPRAPKVDVSRAGAN